MMHWIIALHIIVLSTINIKPVLTRQGRLVCVKPTHKYNATEDYCEEWSSIISSPDRYFTSHTHIKLLPGVYHINETYNLSLISITNFSIVGSEANKIVVTIKCFSNKANQLIHITNSSFVEIRYIKLIDCGGHMKPVKKRNMFPSAAGTVLFLQNVQSIKLMNISFENSHGHCIFGLNVMGFSFFKGITIFISKLQNTKVYSGGIILLYTNISGFESLAEQNVRIEYFRIYNISNINQITRNVFGNTVYDSSMTSASAIGVMFNQYSFSVKIVIAHAHMSSITSKTGPIVYVSYNSSNASNYVNISNTIITNNNNEEDHPNIKVSIDGFSQNHGYRMQKAHFELHNCEISFNKAESNFVYQYPHELTIDEYRNVSFTLKLISTSFTGNNAVNTFMKVNFMKQMSSCFIFIENCTFIFNNGFTIEIDECYNVILFKNNKFYNNSVSAMEHGVLVFDRSYPTFGGYNEFFDNFAHTVLTFHEYVFLKEGSTINISNNTAAMGDKQTPVKALIYFETSNNFQFQPCAFQFLSDQNKIDQLNFNYRLIFHHNQNYSSIVYGALLNNCHWMKNTAFKDLNSNFVYKRIPDLDSFSLTTAFRRRKSTIYFCNDANHVEYFKDEFDSIFPGQNIPVRLIILPPFLNTVLYSINFTTDNLKYKIPYKPCEIQAYQFSWLQLVPQNCTSLSYKAYSNTLEKCYVSFRTAYPDDSLYIYYIDFKECPLGFHINDGLCECDEGLRAAFSNLKCYIQSNTITRPGGSWIGSSHNDGQMVILYAKVCTVLLCNEYATDVQLDIPDTQCINNRAGIACGHCPSGLDAIFGSLKCVKCSNNWLFLLPIFILAGIFLVLALFALNLTVVNGTINGFILYVNSIVAYVINVRLQHPAISIPVSLFSLDLGIETCFYHGMTEYDKTWLQLAFPSYLLFIVAMLAFASRYSSLVERLTRRRVIPVIATIFLLSYSKILLVTVRVLFSYTNVYSLPDNKKIVIWKWDSSIPLFGLKFLILFVVCLVVLLFVLLPLTLLLTFTKQFYHCKLVVKYLKPYLDAFQAPFIDSCRYYPGMELFIRSLSFVVASVVLDSNKTQALATLFCVVLLVYLCSFKPFKCISRTILYTSFLLNLQCLLILAIYLDGNFYKTSHKIFFAIPIFIAFVEFGGIVLHCLYINHLYKIGCLQTLIMKLKNICYRFIVKSRRNALQAASVNNYEQYQEELLALDPQN